ncbi:hypothetical protein DYB37_009051 [Aphanomyces astaci]|uniref:Uncharacterized protein n=1 Tax=Aphanomyces astaci TaxID=112090 RepID=A0A397BAF8_APHAT|nr:hypothetical protein DYB36_007400 [Aphanomyces astaci]RHY17243.1 hypothetical protein DYB25_002781 [Aphanomyces astaci]RHY68618.1 hypothetical protein DYB30_009163 [Aphanomyces astaci]RHY96622.1 hypothetical protein DYB35_003527 [Aphanomyces astaci]RHZ14971.1 hypothetical protein DYB37_009051 [Aphanomyces astaci]
MTVLPRPSLSSDALYLSLASGAPTTPKDFVHWSVHSHKASFSLSSDTTEVTFLQAGMYHVQVTGESPNWSGGLGLWLRLNGAYVALTSFHQQGDTSCFAQRLFCPKGTTLKVYSSLAAPILIGATLSAVLIGASP